MWWSVILFTYVMVTSHATTKNTELCKGLYSEFWVFWVKIPEENMGKFTNLAFSFFLAGGGCACFNSWPKFLFWKMGWLD